MFRSLVIPSSVFFLCISFIPHKALATTQLPATIPGTIGWYDAASTTSFYPSTSAPTTWLDSSGLGQNLTIPSGRVSYQNYGNVPMLRFTSTSSPDVTGAFTIGTSSPITVYAVFVPDPTNGFSGLLNYIATGDPFSFASPNSSALVRGDCCVPALGVSSFRNWGGVDGTSTADYSYYMEINAEPTLYSITYNGSTSAAYLNGRLEKTAISLGFLGPTGVLDIGGGDGYNPPTFTGYLAELVIRNTADSTSTRQQFESYFASKWGIKNTVQPQDIWAIGDSITAGAYTNNPWPSVFQTLSYPSSHNVSTRNLGDFGFTSSSAQGVYTNSIQPYFVSGNTVVSAWGINDISGGGTAAGILSNMEPVWASIKAAGGKVYVTDLMFRTGLTSPQITQLNLYNSSIDGLVASGTIAGHVRYLTDPRLTDPTNTTYFVDGVHPTQAGQNIMAQIVADTLYGSIPLSISAVPSSSGATITWTTSGSSTSQVQYGLTSSYTASSTLNIATTTSHTVTLTGLSPLTTYHYNIISEDYLTDVSTSSDQTFTTLAAPTPSPSVPAGSYSSGGGGSVSPTALASILAPSASTTAYLNSLKSSVPGCPAGLVCVTVATSTIAIATSTFTRDLTLGSQGNDVKTLQMYLNSHGFIVATYGNGSSGHETNYFGSLTQAALAKFQQAHGISPSVGYFGPITRAKIRASA